jgi:hypothetical protein
MKKILLTLLMMSFCSISYAADTKVSALGSVTPSGTDLIYVVNDPSGTPISKKSTLSTLFANIDSPITTSSTVNVGSSQLNSSALSVDMASNNVGITIQGTSGQTADLFVIEKSDGTEILTFDNDGLLTVGSIATTSSGQSSVDNLSVSNTLFLGGTAVTSDVYYTNSTSVFSVNSALAVGASTPGTDFCNDANAIGCWDMESSGSEVDITSNATTLTVSSGDTISLSTTKKYGTYSRIFQSANDEYLEAPDGGVTDINGADQDISICAFIQVKSTGANQNIVSKYDSGTSNRSYAFYINSSDQVTFRLSADGSAVSTATSSTTLSTNTWYHVCGVYNDTDIRTYVNGSLDGTPAAHTTGLFNSNAVFAVGTQFSSGSATASFNGLIDNVIVLDRELTSAEVSSINSGGMQGTGGGGVSTFTDSDATPDVSSASRWITGTVATTITDFDGSAISTGQILYIESDGAITYDCTSSGLKCGSTDIVTADGDYITFIYNGVDWMMMSFTDQSDNYN